MTAFYNLLRRNPNYRNLWLGQVVSEVGDHFNSIAVLSLALHLSGSGATVGGVMIARMVCAIAAAPLAGVALDRMDRRHVMIASDLARAVVAVLFVAVLRYRQEWFLFALSGMLMFASPFFTAGRSAILPKIVSPEELHSANALTQTTAWLTLTIGTMLGGVSTMQFGYAWAFAANCLSFLLSAVAVWSLRSKSGFRAERREIQEHESHRQHFWAEFTDSLRYMKRTPLVLAVGLAGAGWASGGGAAQILFTLFGEVVFQQGATGVGLIWGFAGVGLVIGGFTGLWLGKRLTYDGYLRAIGIGFLVHGIAYTLFAMSNLALAIVFIMISRVAMGTNNVLNRSVLLKHVPDQYRGRVFTTVEAMMNGTMMLSMGVASAATLTFPIRTIGIIAGLISASSAVVWFWAMFTGRLPEPAPVEPEERVPAKPVTPA